jgi:hypothetical protein
VSNIAEEMRAALEAENLHNQRVVALQLEHARFKMALESIAINTCCEKCQEAALIARAALQQKDPPVPEHLFKQGYRRGKEPG